MYIYWRHNKSVSVIVDDLFLMSGSPTGLQNSIDGLENYTRRRQQGWKTTSSNLPLMPTTCQSVKQYNYLGVIFSDRKNRFEENYEQKYGKVLRTIYASHNLGQDVIGPDIAAGVLFKVFIDYYSSHWLRQGSVLWWQTEKSFGIITFIIFKTCAMCLVTYI